MTSEPQTFAGRAPCTDDRVLAALPYHTYERALEMCKLLVESWLRDVSYCRSGPSKQKWEFSPSPWSFDSQSGKPPQKAGDDRWKLVLATARNQYSITVSPTYLGCVVVSRVIEPGEKGARGNDLHDGPFNRITWAHIVTEMLAYELVDIPKEEEQPELVDLWKFVDEAHNKDKADWAVKAEEDRRRPILVAAGPGQVAAPVLGAGMATVCAINWCRFALPHQPGPDSCSRCVNGCRAGSACSDCPPGGMFMGTEKTVFIDPIVDGSAHLS